MLSCDCDFYEELEPEPGYWCYAPGPLPNFEPLKSTRRKRCCSCNKLINTGNLCLVFNRHRYPYTEIEARIANADWDLAEEPPIQIADHHQCERCGEIYLNLTDLGYCIPPAENMEAALKEYQKLSNFKGGKDD